MMTTDPLDMTALLSLAEQTPQALSPESCLGHIHLRVNDLRAAREFYVDRLGFDLMVDFSHFGALFVSGAIIIIWG
ncbi:MAG: VOC family protein [Deinococcales bacterium]